MRPTGPTPMGGVASEQLFVGRTRELGLVAAVLDEARAARPRVLLIEGPAGIGKTALLQRALRDVEFTVADASGDEHEAGVPFALLDQLLRRISRRLGHPPAHVSDQALDLPDAIAGGARLIDALGQLQSDGPVALVVDDLHWCDTPSLQALVFALRRLGADEIAVLLAVRSEASAGLPRGLLELVASDRGARLPLTGLEGGDVRELAAALGAVNLPRRAIDRLTAHTRGNPLYARALLQELEPGALISCGEMPLPAPQSYDSLVRTRLRGCSPATVWLVVCAAILGNRCSLLDASRLAGLNGSGRELEEARTRRLLRVIDTELGPDLVFMHPLVRASIYHDLDPAERAELHERAATLVEDDRIRLGHRAAAAAGDDPELAEGLVALAAKELAAGLVAAPAAADALRAAARVAGSRRERETHLLGALECLIAAGDLGTAGELAATLVGYEDTAGLRYIQGALALHTARIEDAERLLTSAWAMVGPNDDPCVAAGVASQLAILHLRRADVDQIALWARRSLDAGGPRIPAVPSARTALALGLAAEGRYAEAAAATPPHLERPCELGPAELELLLARGIVHLWSDEPVAASRDLSTMVEAARRHGLIVPGLFALGHLSEAEFRLGAWDDAIAHSQLAVSIAEDTDQFGMLATLHGDAALPLACRGDWTAAEGHVSAALGATTILADAVNVTWAHSARAMLAAARRDLTGVVESCELIEAALEKGGDQPAIKPWRILGAEALAALGDAHRADGLLRPFEERAETAGLPYAALAAARARGLVEVARGRPKRAEQAFELALLGPSTTPFEHAQAELAYGAFLRRRGSRGRASSLLMAAEETFVALGAEPYVARTQRELAGCGLTPARRTPEARYQLTPQEQTVAHLVAKGLRNREVAAELVVSVKTIEYHLGNIYRKLQLSSRTQLAARLAGGGRAPFVDPAGRSDEMAAANRA